MNNVVLAYEKIDKNTFSGWNYNGRIEPSSIPLTTSSMNMLMNNSFMLDVYNTVVIPDPNTKFPGMFRHVPPGYKPIVKQIDEIVDEKYAYLLEIHNSWVLTQLSHYAINEKVLSDARAGQAYIVLVYHNEGDISGNLYFLRTLVNDLNVPKAQIFLLHGDYDVEKYKDEPYTYVPVNCFTYWVQQYQRDNLIDYVPDKLFTCYNRQPRPHRIVILSLLHQHALVERGIVSCGPSLLNDNIPLKGILENVLQRTVSYDDLKFFTEISNSSPDDLNLGVDNPAANIVEEHYQHSFVSVINETLTNSIFFSEKIYKPILIGHPFLLMGAPNQLAKLREQFRFKTFGQWWDESYDEIDDMHLRAKSIVDILVSLNSKTEQELIDIREEMKPTLKYNQNLYNSIVANNVYGSEKPIWNFLHKLFNP
jgi:hypothetical protein